MSIKSTRYVDIASAVIGEQSVPQRKLVGRIFTQSALIPAGTVVSFSSGEVERLFGPDAPESRFAGAYFSYVSPAPVSRPSELQIAPYAPAGRAGTIFGGAHAPLAQLQGVNAGELALTLGQDAVNATAIDLTAAQSFADVATAIEGVAPNISVQYDAVTKRFILTGSTIGAGDVTVTPTGLANALGLTDQAAIYSGGEEQQTALSAFQSAESVSDSFGSAYFIDDLTLEQIVPVAEYVAAENVKYQFHVDVPRAEVEEYSAALIGTASVGLNLLQPGEATIAHLPMSILAATNYDRTNAATNYMFRRGGVTIPAQVTTAQDADALDALRVNYYGQTSSAGVPISFYQRGLLCGGAGAPVSMSVHANEQWLKSYIAAQWLSLLLDTGGIPANADGRGRGLVVVGEAITRAIDNGTIIAGKELTPIQRAAVSDASGDPMAWHDVQSKGYWYDVAIVPWNDAPSGQPEYQMLYTIVYSKGDWVNRIQGSHQLV